MLSMAKKQSSVLERVDADIEAAEARKREAEHDIERLKAIRDYLLAVPGIAGRRPAKRLTQLQALIDILKETGKPTDTMVLTERLLAQGFGKSRESLRAALYSVMHKNKQIFVNDGAGMWSLRG